MELNIHLDPESAKKLAYLQQYEAQDPASLLTKAIEQRYQSLCPPSESPYHVFEKLGLVGCMDGMENLPLTDQPSIREKLHQKRREGTL